MCSYNKVMAMQNKRDRAWKLDRLQTQEATLQGKEKKGGREPTAPVREARSVSEGHPPRLQRVSDRKNIPVEH